MRGSIRLAIVPRSSRCMQWPTASDAHGELMLVVDADEAQLRQSFESWERRAEIDCAYCMEQMDAPGVHLCRQARRPLGELWPQMRFYR